MFPSLTAGALPYDPPWEREPIEDRLSTIDRAGITIVWLYEKPDTSTFRYRVYNMVEALVADPARRARATWCAVAEIPSLLPRLADVDTLVLARVRYDADVARLITAAKA